MSRIGPKNRIERGRLPEIRRSRLCCTAVLAILVWSLATWGSHGANGSQSNRTMEALQWPIVVTQVAPISANGQGSNTKRRTIPIAWGDQAKLLLIQPDGSVRRLAESFHSACDPDVSFDGKRILFAGRPTADDSWGIYELSLHQPAIRQVVSADGACRNPRYLSTLYTIVSDKPWYQVLFVMSPDASRPPYGGSELYSCKLDGSELTRLTNTLSTTADPVLMSNGRVLFASWQPTGPLTIDQGRVGLFAMNLDGTDYATFAGNQGRRIQHMPCVTTDGLLICVEAVDVAPDGSGMLGSVQMRRPLHSYRSVTGPDEGLFHSPSPLPDGSVLLSWRSGASGVNHAVYRFDPKAHTMARIYDDPRYDEIQAQVVRPRREPDGRSSVVRASDPFGEFYCLDAYTSDQEFTPGSLKRVRVIQGLASATRGSEGPEGLPGISRQILGEVPVESDGSFRVKVPANQPIQLQLLDSQGTAIRTCRWIWVRNREPRGCIGCHEDGELTPENLFVEAMEKHSNLLQAADEADRPQQSEKDDN